MHDEFHKAIQDKMSAMAVALPDGELMADWERTTDALRRMRASWAGSDSAHPPVVLGYLQQVAEQLDRAAAAVAHAREQLHPW
ncbi:hypothetical protein D5S17_34020 [Pseudonocardiaceae bacterium YIM PH 21723]|nr:hypothetical protein D5S17_34020 [Pseudonocardiaceae bacterium YIM PH 21723]